MLDSSPGTKNLGLSISQHRGDVGFPYRQVPTVLVDAFEGHSDFAATVVGHQSLEADDLLADPGWLGWT